MLHWMLILGGLAAVSLAVLLLGERPGAGAPDTAGLAQPLPFNHRHHTGQMGIDCRHCHTEVEVSAHAGLPPAQTCVSCHYPVAAPPPLPEPFRWRRHTALPDFIHFDHSIHVQKGVGCSTCHGRVDEMVVFEQRQPFTMSWCLACHRDPTPHLRLPQEIFQMDWEAPPDQQRRGERLAGEHGIRPDRLLHCNLCHR